MYQLVVLFYCFAVGVSDPANWPFPSNPGQSATPSNWQSSGSVWPSSGGQSDPRGEGWSSGSGSGGFGFGPGSGDFGSGPGVSGWGSKSCGGTVRSSRSTTSVFDIERQLLGAGQRMVAFCNAFSNRPLREIYGVEHFKLLVSLSEFSENDIQVSVNNDFFTYLVRDVIRI